MGPQIPSNRFPFIPLSSAFLPSVLCTPPRVLYVCVRGGRCAMLCACYSHCLKCPFSLYRCKPSTLALWQLTYLPCLWGLPQLMWGDIPTVLSGYILYYQIACVSLFDSVYQTIFELLKGMALFHCLIPSVLVWLLPETDPETKLWM